MTVYPKFEKRTKVIRNTSNKLTKSSRGIWSASTQLSRGELIAMVVPFVFSESEVTFTIPLRRRSFCAQIKSCVESRELKRHMRCDSAFRSDSNRWSDCLLWRNHFYAFSSNLRNVGVFRGRRQPLTVIPSVSYEIQKKESDDVKALVRKINETASKMKFPKEVENKMALSVRRYAHIRFWKIVAILLTMWWFQKELLLLCWVLGGTIGRLWDLKSLQNSFSEVNLIAQITLEEEAAAQYWLFISVFCCGRLLLIDEEGPLYPRHLNLSWIARCSAHGF